MSKNKRHEMSGWLYALIAVFIIVFISALFHVANAAESETYDCHALFIEAKHYGRQKMTVRVCECITEGHRYWVSMDICRKLWSQPLEK